MEGHAELLKELRLAGVAAREAGLADLALLLKRAHDAVTGEDALWEPVMAKIKELGGMVTQLKELSEQQGGKLYALTQALATRDPSVRPDCLFITHDNSTLSTGCGGKLRFNTIDSLRFCPFCGYRILRP